MNKVLTIAVLLMLTTLGARAEQHVNIVVKPSASAGTVTYQITGAINGVGGVCTLTVTPASGYYLKIENLTATTSLDGSGVQAPRMTRGIDVSSETLTITASNASADPSSVTTYTFNMPTDGALNVDVTAEFKLLETPSYSVSVTGWTYGASTNAPVLTGYAGDQTKVDYYYKLSSSDTWSAWSGISSTTDAGNYDIKASVPAYKEYAASEVTSTFTISKANMNVVTIEAIDDQTFAGKELEPDVTVMFNNETVATDEYTVSYEDNVNVGEATVTLTGSGKNFVAGSTTTANFTIEALSLDNAIVGVDENATYSGSKVEPTVTVQLIAGGDALKQDVDYEVAYSNNINAASADDTVAPTVTITGIGNYTGSMSVTFTIKPLSLATGFTVSVDATKTYTYMGEEIKPTPTVTPTAGGNALEEDKDYEVVSWSNNINAAKADDATAPTITVTGKGNYTGSASGTFTIQPKAVTIVAGSQQFTYDGTAHSCADFQVEGLVGSDQIEAVLENSITFPSQSPVKNTIKSYSFTTGEADNYDVSTVDGELTMTNASQPITITAVSDSWTYDGSAHTAPTVTLTKGSLFTGDELLASATGSVTNVADTKSGNNPIADGYKIMHGTEDVTENYVITTEAGTLTVVCGMDDLFGERYEWATYVARENLTLPEGIEAYAVTDVTTTEVEIEAIGYIPAGMGILLKRSDTTNNSYVGTVYEGTATTLESKLTGSATAATDLMAFNDFVLYRDEFVLSSIGSIEAGKAYLPAAIAPANAARQLAIGSSGTTGIGSVAGNAIADDKWFDLQGRRLDGAPVKKGLYIKNGKKTIIK